MQQDSLSSQEKEQHLEFDVDQAGEENKNNPIYYIQYAHARITKILNNLDNKRVSEENYDNLKSKNEIEILGFVDKVSRNLK